MRARTWLCATSLACAAALGVVGCPAAEEQAVTKSAVEHGEALFKDPTISGTSFNQLSCASCHEAHAGDTGLTLTGAPLAGVLERDAYWGGSVPDLLESVNACLYYFMLANDPWTGEEVEARAIYAYLESLEAEADPSEKEAIAFTIAPLADTESGDAKKGGEVYQSACGTCHGAKSTGLGRTIDKAPTLPEETLKVHPEPDYSDADRRFVFIEKTRHGGFLGYGGQMPPFSEEVLSDQELTDLLTYLGVP